MYGIAFPGPELYGNWERAKSKCEACEVRVVVYGGGGGGRGSVFIRRRLVMYVKVADRSRRSRERERQQSYDYNGGKRGRYDTLWAVTRTR